MPGEKPPRSLSNIPDSIPKNISAEIPTSPEAPLENKNESQQSFLTALNQRVSPFAGDLEAQGWKKTSAYEDRDISYAWPHEYEGLIRRYPVTLYERKGWEIKKTDYDPEHSHVIFDIRYVLNKTGKRIYRQDWSARVESQTKDGKEETGIYLRTAKDEAAGFHFVDKEYQRVSRHHVEFFNGTARNVSWVRADNYRSFNWDYKLIEKNLPPLQPEDNSEQNKQ